MVAKVLFKQADSPQDQIIFRNSGDYAPGASAVNNLEDDTAGNITFAQLDLTSLANGAARQSAKVDLLETRPQQWGVMAAIEFVTAPTLHDTVEFYWGASASGTAGKGNPGNLTGADGAYTGTTGSTEENTFQLLDYINPLILTADVQPVQVVGFVGVLTTYLRYGSLVVYNRGGQAFNSDAIEMSVALTPLIPESQ